MLSPSLLLIPLALLTCVGYCQEQSRFTTVVSNEEAQQLSEQLRSGSNGELREPTCTQQLANITAFIQQAVASEISAALDTSNTQEAIAAEVSAVLEQHLSSAIQQLYPAASCKQFLENDPTSPSGYYWIQASDGSAVRVHCDMTRTCGGVTGGWTRIAHLDMRESDSQCPTGLQTRNYTSGNISKRLCGIDSVNATYSPVVYTTHGIEYTQVCGKIIAFQDGSTDAFSAYHQQARVNRTLTIDDNYVDGISLTHGRSPRQHIWTFAAALDEVAADASVCPCTNTNVSVPSPPSFVGNNSYFCDTASRLRRLFIHFIVISTIMSMIFPPKVTETNGNISVQRIYGESNNPYRQ